MKYGLSDKQLQEIAGIISSYSQIEQALIFGSRAIDTYKEASDVDIAIKGSKADSKLAAALKDQLEEETYLPFFFDVIAYHSVQSEALKKHIRTKGKSIYRKSLEGWREVKLGDVIEIIGGGTPRTSVPEYWGGGIPWLTPNDLSNYKNKYIYNGKLNISKLGLEQSSAKLLPQNTILLSTRAPVGYLAIAGAQVSTNQGFRSLIPNSKINNIFLFYLLKNNVEYLKSQSGGTTFGELSGTTLKSLSFIFPPLPEQKAIAEVLSSLDDKIELLHRQNKTLEDIGQALFRQWFIEQADTGWDVGTLGDMVDISSGKSLKMNKYNPSGKYPILGANGEIGRTSNYLLDERVIFTGRVGTLGNIFISATKAWLSDNTLIIKPIDNHFYYVYYALKNIGFKNLNVGSTQPLIRQSDLKNIELLLPENNILYEFEQQMDNFFIKNTKNKQQINTLENLRDTLLPKLMSSEIRIKDFSL